MAEVQNRNIREVLKTRRHGELKDGSAQGYQVDEIATSQDMVRVLINNAIRFPVLSRIEEVQLAKNIENATQSGNEEERNFYFNKFVNHNLRIPIFIAKKFQNNGVELSDLIQEGNIGLVRAARKFDYKKGNSFFSFAKWDVRRAITHAIAFQARAIHIPEHVIAKVEDLDDVVQNLTLELGNVPTIADVAERTGMDVDEINYLQSINQRIDSLNTPINEDGDETGDFISDDYFLEDEVVSSLSVHQEVDELLSQLSERERLVLDLKWGLSGNEHSAKEVGKILNVSRQIIQRNESSAFGKLQTGTCVFKADHSLISQN